MGTRMDVVMDGSTDNIQLDFVWDSRYQTLKFGLDLDFNQTTYTFTIDGNIVRIAPTPVAGALISIVRHTFIDQMRHIYTQGAKFSNITMDENFEQLLRAVADMDENTQYMYDWVTGQVNTIETLAIDAKNAATSAKEYAVRAEETADRAEIVANGIDGKATEALSKATGANALSTDALRIASGIDAKATTAMSDAAKAVTTANSAKTTAEGIDAKASSALTNANSAVSTANSAKSTAEGIDAKATSAVTTANTAKATADTAKATADSIAGNKYDKTGGVIKGNIIVRNPAGDPASLTIGRDGISAQNNTGNDAWLAYLTRNGQSGVVEQVSMSIPAFVHEGSQFEVGNLTARQNVVVRGNLLVRSGELRIGATDIPEGQWRLMDVRPPTDSHYLAFRKDSQSSDALVIFDNKSPLSMFTPSADSAGKEIANAAFVRSIHASDSTIKSNLEEVIAPLDDILGIKVYTYEQLGHPNRRKVGTLAQDWIAKFGSAMGPTITYTYTDAEGTYHNLSGIKTLDPLSVSAVMLSGMRQMRAEYQVKEANLLEEIELLKVALHEVNQALQAIDAQVNLNKVNIEGNTTSLTAIEAQLAG